MICCVNSLSLLGHSTILDCNIIGKKKKTLALGKIFKIVNIFTLLYG